MNSNLMDSLLLVEDNLGDARLFREMFNEQGPHNTAMTHVMSMSEAEQYLSMGKVDIILLDLGLPDAEGLGAVRRARAAAPTVPLVVLTGWDDDSLAGRALQEGAQDYLIKGEIETRGLLRALRYAIERKVMEEALFAEKERAQVTLNSIGDGVGCTDSFGNITFLNLVAEKMTGWWCQEATGRPMAEVFRILDATSRVEARMALRTGQSHPADPASNDVLIRRDGFETPIEDSVSPIHDRQGNTTGAVIVLRDVSAARAVARQMTHLAQHDFLTDLPNRMLLNDRLGQAIVSARRREKKVAVLFLDLDGFKHINDSLGHRIGDKLLQSVASRLVACVRESDTVSRQGGDEFVVLLSEVEHSEDVAITAGRMLQAVAEAHSIEGHDLHVTSSIGVSTYPDDGLNAETLLKNADTAMYQAKENGRQSFQFFKPAMNIRAVDRQST
jgi:diguanylate cyclase (GGDEF)-like protein/PAS domain S-box-containing protein